MIDINNYTIKKKLFILVIIGILAIISVGIFSISSTQQINSQLDQLYQNKYVHSKLALSSYSEMLSYAIVGYQLALEPNVTKKQDIINSQMDPKISSYNKILDEYKSIPMSEEETKIYDDLTQFSSEYFSAAKKTNELRLEGKDEEANAYITEVTAPARLQTYEKLQNLIELNNQSAYQYYNNANAVFNSLILITIIITILCSIILLIISGFIIRNLTRRCNSLLNGMDEVGRGNLSYRINLTGNDEISHMGSSFDKMTTSLEEDTLKIKQNIEGSTRTNTAIMKTSEDIKNGRLSTKIDTERFEGEFLITVKSVNELLDTITIPVNETLRVAERYAHVDFTERFDESINVKGDLLLLKEKINQIGIHVGTELGTAMKEITKEVNSLTVSSIEAANSVDAITKESAVIAQSSSIVNMNADNSLKSVEQVQVAIDELNESVSTVAIKVEAVNRLSQKTNETSFDGIQQTKVAEKGIKSIDSAVSDVGNIISDIKNQMADIGKIIEIIGDIADQTNLLALNAAIEAARAGDAGKGFAVVANEVKTLAQESQQSSDNIAKIISTLQIQSEQAESAMNLAITEVKKGSQAITDSINNFHSIAKEVEEIAYYMTEIASLSEEEAAAVEEITASVSEVKGLSEETASEAAGLARASEKSSVAINQVSIVVGNLSQVAARINDSTSRLNA